MWQKLIAFIICNLAFIILIPTAKADFQFTPDSTSISPETEINVQVNLSLQGQANKKYFLEGAFKKVDGSNYFGLTQKDGTWVPYTASNFASLPEVITDGQGAWQGSMKVKLDLGSSNFGGNGDYILQIKRFTEGGSGSFSDNQGQISVTGSVTTTPAPSAGLGPSASPVANATSASTKSSFTFSSLPSSINSDQSFSVGVVISNDKPNSILYLKGAFFRDGATNYFGKTQVGSLFVKNSASYSDQPKITTDNNGNWSGTLTVMPDVADSGFTGSGSYKFKFAKYNSVGSGPTWTDSASISINQISTPAPSAKPTTTPTSAVSSGLGGQQVLGASAGGEDQITLADNAGMVNIPDLESSNSATPAAIINTRDNNLPNASPYNWWYIGLGLVALAGSCVPLIKTGKLGALRALVGI